MAEISCSSMSTEEDMFFVRPPKNELTHEEIWDDSLLIQHYDKAMKMAREKLANKKGDAEKMDDCASDVSSKQGPSTSCKNHSAKKKSKSNNKKKSKKNQNSGDYQWKIGDDCLVHYDDDMFYEATVLSVNSLNATCVVKYVGYDIQEAVSTLFISASKGFTNRLRQMQNSEENPEDNYETNKKAGHHGYSEQPQKQPRNKQQQVKGTNNKINLPHIPYLPPPPAIGLCDSDEFGDTEALHTMLMSWYMTGYHTGYYQGFKESKKKINHGKRK